MSVKSKVILRSCLLLLVIVLAACATAPPKHPAYLHALSDLRAARWMLEHRPGDAAVTLHEDEAVSEIDRAIAEIRDAAIDDGKNIHDHPNVDLPRDFPGRLHRAAELLRQVRADTAREEDDPSARGLRNRAIGHVDAALHATERAIHDVEFGR
jgi:hypothetical protein